ncbi:MAG: acyltransferase [Bacteroidales bacterium]|jgi:hypothetical protein|nr:acyltransferase [Bacteroidales bacterium]
MEKKDKETGSAMPESSNERVMRKIRIIRFILLSTVLFIISDTIGRWFLPEGARASGVYLALIWMLCLVTGAFQFYVFRKIQTKWIKWAAAGGYSILFVIVLALFNFYRGEKPDLIGYRISVTFMPIIGFAIVTLTTSLLKWYGQTIKRIFRLDSINNFVFILFMLIPIVLIILLIIGSYRLTGSLSERGREIQQFISEGEINRNTDRREPSRQYDRIFNDLNEIQLEAAKKNGLKSPVSESDELSRDLVKINSNKLYHIDHLTHSIPYLVPKAAQLLEDMGSAFQDSLFNRGYNRNHKFTVSSVLRTEENVKQLRKTNVNSTENSCHCYGTTFDISYFTFHTPHRGKKASVDKMRQILMQVAYDMRRLDRCYVKYEKQTTCLHITVR